MAPDRGIERGAVAQAGATCILMHLRVHLRDGVLGGWHRRQRPTERFGIAAGQGDQVVEAQPGRPLLAGGQMGSTDGPGQAPVTDRILRQHHQMITLGIGPPYPLISPGGGVEGELGPEHRRQAVRPRRLSEADHAVEPVMVGDGQRGEAEPDRLFGQLLGMRSAVEEAEVGMAVQLGIGHARLGSADQRYRLIGRPLARPCRRVTSIGRDSALGGGQRVPSPVR